MKFYSIATDQESEIYRGMKDCIKLYSTLNTFILPSTWPRSGIVTLQIFCNNNIGIKSGKITLDSSNI